MHQELKAEVFHYADFLVQKYAPQNQIKQEKRKAGSAIGKYTLAPDFDEPLDDFKE